MTGVRPRTCRPRTCRKKRKAPGRRLPREGEPNRLDPLADFLLALLPLLLALAHLRLGLALLLAHLVVSQLAFLLLQLSFDLVALTSHVDPPFKVGHGCYPAKKSGNPALRLLRAGRPLPAPASRPPHLGHRPLQLPLHLLHAEGGLREQLSLPTQSRPAHVRGDRAARADLRLTRRGEDPPDGRGTAPPARDRKAGRNACGNSRARPHDDDERDAPPTEGEVPRGRGAQARHREPRLSRRRRVQRAERRRLSRRPRARGRR